LVERAWGYSEALSSVAVASEVVTIEAGTPASLPLSTQFSLHQALLARTFPNQLLDAASASLKPPSLGAHPASLGTATIDRSTDPQPLSNIPMPLDAGSILDADAGPPPLDAASE
jgi:hypothetical protein